MTSTTPEERQAFPVGLLPRRVNDALDWAMDRSVVPGYSAIGYRLRGLDATPAAPAGSMAGREVVVTGASSGIGAAAAEQLAGAGARVHMVVRDRERGADARARISERTGRNGIELHVCDVSDLSAVRALAESLSESLTGLDALIHNAGVLLDEPETSADGHEMTLAVHVLGPLLLTRLLEPLLAARAPSRVVFVSSGGMYTERLDVDDLELTGRDFDGPAFYAHAKRIQVVLTGLLAGRLGPRGIVVHAMHPGWADTPGVSSGLPRFHSLFGPILRNPDQGADTAVWLAAADAPLARNGQLWMDRRPRPLHRVPWTQESAPDRARLWHELCEMTGLAGGGTTAGPP